jgi:CBS domain-containing protein
VKFVKEILRTKGTQVWSVPPNASLKEALHIMADKNVGALLVIDNDKVVGIFSERDYARRVVLNNKSATDTPVHEVMISDVLYVKPDDKIEFCMELISDKHIRHLPVLENGNLAGIISIGDIVKATIAEMQYIIKQLDSYITRGR